MKFIVREISKENESKISYSLESSLKIAFLYSGGRLRRIERVRRGSAASDFFYGSEELRSKGNKIDLFELENHDNYTFVRMIGDLLQYKFNFLPPRLDGRLIENGWIIHKQLKNNDVVVVAGIGPAFLLSILRCFGLISIPIVALNTGLFNFKYNMMRRLLTRYLLSKMWTQLFGDGEYKAIIDFFRIKKEYVVVNQCATDTLFWTPGEKESNYVLSVGNDGRRDYNLLIKAAWEIDTPFKIITKIKIDENIPCNVDIVKGDMRKEILSDEELREIYQSAKIVVIPLIESLQPSGQSVCLQAMACGKPVIMTKTIGLWSESIMKNGFNVMFVPPGDKEYLIKTINYLNENENERKRIGLNALETVNKYFNMSDYADRLMNTCKKAIHENR